MNITKRKSLALALSACMILQTVSTVAFAQGSNITLDDNMTITNNADGSMTITEKNCEHHTHDETCGYIKGVDCNFDVTTCEECNAVIDSDETDPPLGEQIITEITPLDKNVITQQVEIGTLESEVKKKFPSKLEVVTAQNTTATTAPVTWETKSTFTEETADAYTLTDDTYIYTAKIAEGYIVDKGVSLPTIAVNIVAVTPQITAPTNKATSGTDWTLTDSGLLTITSDVGMTNWQTNGATTNKADVKDLVIGANVTNISSSMFSEYTGLASVTFNENSKLTSIGYRAFSGSSITEIVIPNSVTTIDSSAFSNCKSLTTVTINTDSKLVSIGDFAFKETSISKILIPNSVTSIGKNAFLDCKSLETVTINTDSNLGFIGDSAFKGTIITSIVIPNSVTTIYDSAFSNCISLATVTINTDSKLKKIGHSAFKGTSITEIVIPNTVISIGSDTFLDCKSLSTVTINTDSKLETIDRSAFSGTSITEIVIPNSVTSIGLFAFANCEGLHTLTMPETPPTAIDGNAFHGTPKNKNIFITNTSGTIIPATQAHKDAYNGIMKTLGATDLRFGIETDTTTNNFGDDVVYGTDIAPKTVSITNTFTFPVTLTQPTSTKFIIGDLSKTVLANGETATFTIAPKSDVSTYTDSIIVTGSANVAVKTFNATQIDADITITPKAITNPTVTGLDSSYTYTGNAINPVITSVQDGDILLVSGADYDVTYGTTNTNVGETGSVIFTFKGNYSGTVTKTFSIVKSDTSTTEGVVVKKGESDANSFTYGETISVEYTPKATGTTTRTALTNKQAQLYYGATELGSVVSVVDGTYTMTYDTTGGAIPSGDAVLSGANGLHIKFGGNDNLKPAEVIPVETVSLAKKQLTWNTDGTANNKTYDGTTTAIQGTAPTLNGILADDKNVVADVGNVNFASEDVGTGITVTATGYGIEGDKSQFYIAPTVQPTFANANITAATPTITVTAEKKLTFFGLGTNDDTITLTATVTGENNEKPTGTVKFTYDTDTEITGATEVELTSGVATFDWVNPNVANYTIKAEFTPTVITNYATATGTSAAFDIDITDQKEFKITGVPSTVTYGGEKFTLGTTGGSGTGTVTYSVPENSAVSVTSGGEVTILKVGTTTITATKAGDTNYNAKTATVEITVKQATPTLAWTSTEQTLTYTGSQALVTEPTVTGVNSQNPTGEIKYAYKSVAGFTTGLFEGYTDGLPIGAGTYKIKAQFVASASTNYTNADSSNELDLTISKVAPTVTAPIAETLTYTGVPQALVTNSSTEHGTIHYKLGNGSWVTTIPTETNATDYTVSYKVTGDANHSDVAETTISNVKISQAPLTVTGGTVTIKQYDENTTATVTALEFEGLKNDETLVITTDYTAGSPTFDNANVGTGKTVTGTASLVDTSEKSKNYSLTGNYTITNGEITLTDGPVAPTGGIVNDVMGTDTFAFSSTNGTVYEYKIGSGNWTEITANGTTTTIPVGNIVIPVDGLQARIKATATHNAGASLTNATAFTASIEGSVAITGTATYGETLTANATHTQEGAVLSYKWLHGTNVLQTGTSNTYKIAGEAVGKTIIVEVTATYYEGSITSSATSAVAKKAVTATAGTVTKVYDGETGAIVPLSITKVNSADEVAITAPNATYDNANVGTNKLIDLGTLTIAGTGAGWYTVTKPSSVAGEITTKPLTNATVTVNGTHSYTGSQIEPTGTDVVVKDGVTALTVETDYTLSYGENKNVADGGTVTATFTGNYSGTASDTFTITAKAITPTVAVSGTYTYTGSQIAPTSADVVVKDNTTALVIDRDYTITYGTNINAGTGTVIVTLKGNYSGSATGTFTIEKADASDSMKTLTGTVLNSGQTKTISLPTKVDGATYGTTTASGTITMTDMGIKDNILTYTAPSSTKGQTGIITIGVTDAKNYNDYDIVVTITSTDKLPQTISFEKATISKTYGEGAFTQIANGAVSGSKVSYASGDTAVIAVNQTTGEVTIKGGGTATITATAASTETHSSATATYDVNVSKATLTINADDKTMTVGDALPTFTATTTGLVNGDKVTTAPTITTTAYGNTLGDFDITITGGIVENSDSYNITHTNGILTVAEKLYPVTVHLNGGNGSPSGAGDYVEGDTVTIHAGSRSGYTFSSWTTIDVTLANTSTTIFIMPDNAVTITANWSKNSSGGGGGNSGGSDNDTEIVKPDPSKPTAPTESETVIPPTVDSNGNASVTIPEKVVDDAVEKAKEEAKKNGTADNGISVTINVKTDKKVNGLDFTLPSVTIGELISSDVKETKVKSGLIEVTLDTKALKEIKSQTKTDVSLAVAKVDTKILSQANKNLVGNRPVFSFTMTDTSGKKVTNFGTGSVSLAIPYELAEGENAGNLAVYYINAEGKSEIVEHSSYDMANGMMIFKTDHFSTFAVGYKETSKFTDIQNHWAKDSIEYVVNRGLFSGTGDGKFSPNNDMTRGMFVTALGRLAEVNVSNYKTGKFTDVKANEYYAPYVNWASKEGIVDGTTATTFAPNNKVTREQMAVILYNYADAIGFDLPKVHAESKFADDSKISTWAEKEVKSMQMSGILSGKDNNKFDPQGTATRAEVSAMMKRFIELVIDSDTTIGQMQNDDGNWVYYKDGKKLIGEHTIGGVKYKFDKYGETSREPDFEFLTYTVQKGDSFWSIAWEHGVNVFTIASVNDKPIWVIIHPNNKLKIPKN